MIRTYSYKRDGGRKLSPHFTVREFRCKDGSDKILIDDQLIVVLESLYVNLNCSAINITSGYRTPSHSVAVGGYATDNHTKGIAADIKCKDKNGRLIAASDILTVYEDLGFCQGAGYINKYAVHIDTRAKKCYFIEPSMKTVSSWRGWFNELIREPFSVFIVKDPALNVRTGPGTSSRAIYTIQRLVRVRISIKNQKGTPLTRGSWGNIVNTPNWVSTAPAMVEHL